MVPSQDAPEFSVIDCKVKVLKEGVGGREQIVRMTKPIGFIGYRALFAGDHYISSAVAIEDSQICIIEKDALFEVVRKNGDLALAMLKELAIELGFSNERTVTLTQKHIRGRLAESLFFLVDTFGYEDDNQTIKVYLSREDIANLSNMTTSNAIRTLSSFSHENVISLDGRKIKILELNTDKTKKFGVKRIGLFGSHVRNEQIAGSDVDILVEFHKGKKLFDLKLHLK